MLDMATVLTKSLRFISCPRLAAGYLPFASIRCVTADGLFAKSTKLTKLTKNIQ
jgi:hypothetical protein